jgi:hypothetical protein
VFISSEVTDFMGFRALLMYELERGDSGVRSFASGQRSLVTDLAAFRD